MRTAFVSAIAFLIFFTSCSTPAAKLSPTLLTADSLALQNYVINTNADTLLQTAGGAWLKIDKGTFSSANGKAAIEIREAYSMAAIIKAGLLTQSNGQPLASGGMIYVNAAARQKITINKPFTIAIPANGGLDKNMQLFKGDTAGSGNINWQKPKPLNENLQMKAVNEGEVLFQQKCASCHGIGKELTGPDLANVDIRQHIVWGGEGEGYDATFLHNYGEALDVAKDSGYNEFEMDHLAEYNRHRLYVCNLVKLYGVSPFTMKDYSKKTRSEYENIYRYIVNKSQIENLPLPKHAYLDDCVDSCEIYTILKQNLNAKKIQQELLRQGLINANGSLVDKRPDPTWRQNNETNTPPADFTDKLNPNEYSATYYQFTIESFGWYNIDMLLNQKDGVKESELFVRVVGAIQEKIKIYLIIPSVKVYGEGGPSEKNDNEYAFFNKNGTIPLPQNAQAYILAVTETKTSVAFALKEFTTQTKQSFDINLKESTRQEFNATIQSMEANNLKIVVAESKNADEIKAADKTIKQLEEDLKNAEKLKPKMCDCDCNKQPTPVTAEVQAENYKQ
jgi:cytochrome c2/ribosome-associated translation inhibitor RaiA